MHSHNLCKHPKHTVQLMAALSSEMTLSTHNASGVCPAPGLKSQTLFSFRPLNSVLNFLRNGLPLLFSRESLPVPGSASAPTTHMRQSSSDLSTGQDKQYETEMSDMCEMSKLRRKQFWTASLSRRL